MTEFEWEQKAKRKEAAQLLATIAKALEGDGNVTLERDSWELKLAVPNDLELGIELEIEEGETELEIELKWVSQKDATGGERKKQSAGK